MTDVEKKLSPYFDPNVDKKGEWYRSLTFEERYWYEDYWANSTKDATTWSVAMMKVFQYMHRRADGFGRVQVFNTHMQYEIKGSLPHTRYAIRRLCDIDAIRLLTPELQRGKWYWVDREITPLFGVKEVATLFDVMPKTVYPWIKAGECTPTRAGMKWWFTEHNIDQLRQYHQLGGKREAGS